MEALYRNLYRGLWPAALHVREQLPARQGPVQLSGDLQCLQTHRRALLGEREERAVLEDGDGVLSPEAGCLRRCPLSKCGTAFPDHALAGHQARGLACGGPHHDLLQLEEYAHRKTQPDRLGLAAEGELPDMVLDMPNGMRTILEEDHVARAVAGRLDALALDHDAAVKDQDGLVEIVIPVELARGAVPDHGRGKSVRALRQHAPGRLRIALDDPGSLNRPRRQFDLGLVKFDQRARHRETLFNQMGGQASRHVLSISLWAVRQCAHRKSAN